MLAVIRHSCALRVVHWIAFLLSLMSSALAFGQVEQGFPDNHPGYYVHGYVPYTRGESPAALAALMQSIYDVEPYDYTETFTFFTSDKRPAKAYRYYFPSRYTISVQGWTVPAGTGNTLNEAIENAKSVYACQSGKPQIFGVKVSGYDAAQGRYSAQILMSGTHSNDGCINPTLSSGTVWVYKLGVEIRELLPPIDQPTKANSDCKAGNPCDVLSGKKLQTESDFDGVIPFKRYYQSMDEGEESHACLGKGWSHSYHSRVLTTITSVTSRVLVLLPDGQELLLSKRGTAFVSDSNHNRVLAAEGDSWVLRLGAQRLIYNQAGQLTSVQYDGQAPLHLEYDEQQRVSAVVADSGQRLDFTYDSNHLLAVNQAGLAQASFSYDDNNNLIAVDYPDSSRRQYHYEDPRYSALLTGISDERGIRYASWSYDDKGRAVLSEHADGAERTSLSYGNPRIVTNALGAVSKYSFVYRNGVARLDSVQDPAGILRYSYNTNGQLLSKTDRRGTKTDYSYSSDGLTETQTEAAGTPLARSSTTVWDSNIHQPLSISDSSQRSDYLYDAQGRRLSQTLTDLVSGATRTTTWTYNAAGQVLSEDGPRTDVSDLTTYSYYSCDHGAECGQLQSVTNALGQTTRYTAYDPSGRLLEQIDANGQVARFAYDARGRLIRRSQVVDGSEQTTQLTYDAVGQVTQVTRPSGVSIQFEYDNARRLTDIEDSLGNRIHYSLNALGQRTATQSFNADGELSASHSAAYDELGQLILDIGAAGQTYRYNYDANGNRLSDTDPNDNDQQQRYDALNQLSEQIDALGASTRYRYDNTGKLVDTTNARGHSTRYRYNGFNDLEELNSPDTGLSQRQYDSAGNLIELSDARGIVTEYRYDALNRLIRRRSTSAPELTVHYHYDDTSDGNAGIGQLTGVEDGSGHSDYRYNLQGQLTQLSQTLIPSADPSQQQTLTLGYSYDADQQLSQIRYPSGRVIDYSRNSAGQIEQITSHYAGHSQTILSDIRYQPFGGLQAATWGNGLSWQQRYDLDQQLTAIQHGATPDPVTLAMNYQHDALGLITAITRPGTEQHYGYDAAQRLTQAQSDSQQTTYDYDAVGNRSQQSSSPSPTAGDGSYSYDSNSNRLNQVNSQSYHYDANGNPIQIGSRRYHYDSDNRLSRITDADSNPIADYSYNAQGQRISKTTTDGTTLFLYNEQGQLLSESSAGQTRDYLYLNSQIIAVADQAQYAYVHSDHLNTAQVITAQDQTIIWQSQQQAFGYSDVDEDPDHDGNRFTYNPRFPGQYFDAETHTHYNYFRDYDPSTGRYLQSDPIGLLGGVNTYAYALDNPMRWTDSLGLDVYLCKRPADLPFPMNLVDHYWLKTDTLESGMGGIDGEVPAQNGNSAWPYTPTETVNHSGESQQENASCEKQEHVDEQCVNTMIEPGQPTGAWQPLNQCHSFAQSVLVKCSAYQILF